MSKETYTMKDSSESTKKYDEISRKIKKLIGATGADYIPELADALREDWYPGLSEDQVNKDAEARERIREKILDEWSRERATDGVWQEISIRAHWLPKWLRDPAYHDRGNKGKAAAEEAKLKKFSLKAKSMKETLDSLVSQLPEPPKDEEEEQEDNEDEPVSYMGEGQLVQPPDPEMPTPLDVYDKTVTLSDKLWSVLVTTDIHKPRRLIPAETNDPLIDFIKPSRKLWLRTLKGLDQDRVSHMLMCLIWLDKLIQDRLRDAKEINRERTEIQQ